jgi:hypothetical protein
LFRYEHEFSSSSNVSDNLPRVGIDRVVLVFQIPRNVRFESTGEIRKGKDGAGGANHGTLPISCGSPDIIRMANAGVDRKGGLRGKDIRRSSSSADREQNPSRREAGRANQCILVAATWKAFDDCHSGSDLMA